MSLRLKEYLYPVNFWDVHLLKNSSVGNQQLSSIFSIKKEVFKLVNRISQQ